MKKLLLNLVFAGLLFALVKFLLNTDLSLVKTLLSFGNRILSKLLFETNIQKYNITKYFLHTFLVILLP